VYLPVTLRLYIQIAAFKDLDRLHCVRTSVLAFKHILPYQSVFKDTYYTMSTNRSLLQGHTDYINQPRLFMKYEITRNLASNILIKLQHEFAVWLGWTGRDWKREMNVEHRSVKCLSYIIRFELRVVTLHKYLYFIVQKR
jgi:hypothetical protein